MKHQPLAEGAQNEVSVASGQPGLTETLDAIRAQLNHLAVQIRSVDTESAVTSQQVRSILNARACRQQFINVELFAEPAWDMLLELFACELEHQRISVSELCRASAVPGTTGLRWIDNLEKEGLVSRHHDQFDKRRVWVRLSSKASDAMQRYFEALPVGSMPR